MKEDIQTADLVIAEPAELVIPKKPAVIQEVNAGSTSNQCPLLSPVKPAIEQSEKITPPPAREKIFFKLVSVKIKQI